MKCASVINQFNDKFWSRETEKFRKSLIYDQTYSKYLVIRLQKLHTRDIDRYHPIVVHFLEIYFVIEIDNVESKFLLCPKCFKMHLTRHPFVSNSERHRIKKNLIIKLMYQWFYKEN